MLIADALDRFLVQLQADGRSPHTIGQYRRHVRALAAWLGPGRAVAEVGHEDIARFLAAPAARTTPRGALKRATSVNALRTSLRCFFAYCRDAGLVPENPARLLRRARCTPPPPRALSDDEQARLVAAIDHPRDRKLVRFMLGTGIRVGSLVALDVADVDFGAGEVRLRTAKGDAPTMVYVPRAIADDLRAWLAGRTTGPLFPTRGGTRLTTRQVHRRVAGWMAKAGLRGSPHSLRHSYATSLYARTGDLLLVQRALRHRSIASTIVYAHADDGRVRAAVQG